MLLEGSGYTTRVKRPHVYVYDLPPNLTSWVNMRRLDRPTHNLFTQRLLSSGARTADGDKADWYFIPVGNGTVICQRNLPYDGDQEALMLPEVLTGVTAVIFRQIRDAGWSRNGRVSFKSVFIRGP